MSSNYSQGLCVSFTTAVVADKWTPLLLFELSQGILHFTALQERLSINPRTLSKRLFDLERFGIITKTVYSETRTEYTLTDKGRALLPIIQQMIEWGARYIHHDT